MWIKRQENYFLKQKIYNDNNFKSIQKDKINRNMITIDNDLHVKLEDVYTISFETNEKSKEYLGFYSSEADAIKSMDNLYDFLSSDEKKYSMLEDKNLLYDFDKSRGVNIIKSKV